MPVPSWVRGMVPLQTDCGDDPSVGKSVVVLLRNLARHWGVARRWRAPDQRCERKSKRGRLNLPKLCALAQRPTVRGPPELEARPKSHPAGQPHTTFPAMPTAYGKRHQPEPGRLYGTPHPQYPNPVARNSGVPIARQRLTYLTGWRQEAYERGDPNGIRTRVQTRREMA